MISHIVLPLLLFAAAPALAEMQSLTVLVVLDGLRHDYLHSKTDNTSGFDAPHLTSLASAGAWLPRLKPVFPSSRLPNVATLATGLFAESHGILDAEEVSDRGNDTIITRDNPKFWQQMRKTGTIWDLHAKADSGKRYTKIIGNQDFIRFLQGNSDDEGTGSGNQTSSEDNTREDADVLEEFGKSLRAANQTDRGFITIFHDEPGRTAQGLGTYAVESAVKSADALVGELLARVEEAGLSDVTNFVVLSTPGYTDVRLDHIVNLQTFAKRDFQAVGSSPVLHIKPVSHKDDALLGLFTELQSGSTPDNYQVFSRETLPPEWHYGSSARAGSIVVVARPGVVFTKDFLTFVKAANARFNRTVDDLSNVYGWNGYGADATQDVWTPVIVEGPEFANGLGMVPSGSNSSGLVNASSVDLFPLLCRVLHLDDAPSRNGSLESLRVLLRPPDETAGQKIKKKITQVVDYATSPSVLPVTASVGTASVILLVILLCVLLARSRHKRFMTQQGFRYSQVRNNRRRGMGDLDEFEDDDDERGLLGGGGGGGAATAATAAEDALGATHTEEQA